MTTTLVVVSMIWLALLLKARSVIATFTKHSECQHEWEFVRAIPKGAGDVQRHYICTICGVEEID